MREDVRVASASNLDIALITAGAALAGVVIGQFGTHVIERLRERRALGLALRVWSARMCHIRPVRDSGQPSGTVIPVPSQLS